MQEAATNPDMAELRQELERVKTRVGQLEQQRNDAIDALAGATGLTRRQVIGIIGGGAGAGALGLLASGTARADASTSDSDGDVGLPGDRVDVFADGVDTVSVDAGAVLANDQFQLTGESKTISGGTVSYSSPFLKLTPEGGAADQLDEVTGGSEGDLLVVTPDGAVSDITVGDNTGSGADGFQLDGSNFVMDNGFDKLICIYHADRWCELSRASNA